LRFVNCKQFVALAADIKSNGGVQVAGLFSDGREPECGEGAPTRERRPGG
jgi:hypothetical protein